MLGTVYSWTRHFIFICASHQSGMHGSPDSSPPGPAASPASPARPAGSCGKLGRSRGQHPPLVQQLVSAGAAATAHTQRHPNLEALGFPFPFSLRSRTAHCPSSLRPHRALLSFSSPMLLQSKASSSEQGRHSSASRPAADSPHESCLTQHPPSKWPFCVLWKKHAAPHWRFSTLITRRSCRTPWRGLWKAVTHSSDARTSARLKNPCSDPFAFRGFLCKREKR